MRKFITIILLSFLTYTSFCQTIIRVERNRENVGGNIVYVNKEQSSTITIPISLSNGTPCLADTLWFYGDASAFTGSKWWVKYADGSEADGTYINRYSDTAQWVPSAAAIDSGIVYVTLTGYDFFMSFLTTKDGRLLVTKNGREILIKQ